MCEAKRATFLSDPNFIAGLPANVVHLDTCHFSTSLLAALKSGEQVGKNANTCVWRSCMDARISK